MTSLEDLNAQISKLTAERDRLQRAADKAASIEFIRVNRITRADVQMSSGKGIPWSGDIGTFGRWCALHSTKRWAEWNGAIQHMSDVVHGRWSSETPGRMEDLP